MTFLIRHLCVSIKTRLGGCLIFLLTCSLYACSATRVEPPATTSWAGTLVAESGHRYLIALREERLSYTIDSERISPSVVDRWATLIELTSSGGDGIWNARRVARVDAARWRPTLPQAVDPTYVTLVGASPYVTNGDALTERHCNGVGAVWAESVTGVIVGCRDRGFYKYVERDNGPAECTFTLSEVLSRVGLDGTPAAQDAQQFGARAQHEFEFTLADDGTLFVTRQPALDKRTGQGFDASMVLQTKPCEKTARLLTFPIGDGTLINRVGLVGNRVSVVAGDLFLGRRGAQIFDEAEPRGVGSIPGGDVIAVGAQFVPAQKSFTWFHISADEFRMTTFRYDTQVASSVSFDMHALLGKDGQSSGRAL